MIPQTTYKETITVGNTQTEQASIELTPHMFDMLSSKVYSNKILAVVREILCNARDAQVMAGIEKPIEVHLPSQLEPYFSIRDFGTGLSEEQVMKLYLRYGYSDKRTSNAVIGGLGIGSKSPLAYSDSFLVISYYEGTVSTYSIYKDQGIPQVSKLSSVPTKEPNGVMVKVVTKSQDKHEFASELKKFARFFDYPIKCNQVELLTPKPYMDTEKYAMYKSDEVGNQSGIKAVMGGVTYSISDTYLEKLPFNTRGSKLILLKFDIGELSVAASREALSEDKGTVANIEKAVDVIVDKYYQDIQKKLDGEDTYYEAYQVLVENQLISNNWNGTTTVNKVGGNQLLWKGKKVEDFLLEELDITVRAAYLSWGLKTAKVDNYKIKSVGADPTVIINDRKGALKLANKLCHDNKCTGGSSYVLIIDPSDGQDITEQMIKDTFKNPTFVKCSEVYEKHFPKTETVKVARSGLFHLTMHEVTELEEEAEGYYMLFNRDKLENEVVNDALLNLNSLRTLLSKMKDLGMFTEDLYICRKGGLPAVKKTKVKELTLKEISKRLLKKYPLKEYSEYLLNNGLDVRSNVRGLSYSKEMLELLFGKAGKYLPITSKAPRGYTSVGVKDEHKFLWHNDNTLEEIVPEYAKLRSTLKGKIQEEISNVKDWFPLLTGFSTYGYNHSTMKEDLEMYIEMKLKQVNKQQS